METQEPVTILLSIGSLVLLGCAGGFLVEALKHVRKLQVGQWPNAFDLVASLVLIAIGGGVAALYFGQVQSTFMAAHIGATAPAVIGAWVSGGPPPPGGGGPGGGGGGGATAIEQVGVRGRMLMALSWRTFPRE